MNRKRLYAGLAVLFLFALVFLLAKQFLFQEEPISSRSGREIYETLMSLKPGTSVEKVQEILGKPDDVAGNVLNWFHVDGQGKVGAAFSVVTSQGRATASSYFEYAKDKRAVSRRYKTVQRELSPVLGSPVQEVPGFACVWFPEKLQFSLMIAEDEQPPVVGFLLKEPLIEGR
ncbi:hypothetical protein [uncultured Fretibacterium sp.]|uniref:hypothetical protein n=1 Tax=uncultured Fretibacterium sp. TaxID=1678694 RepID=UPI00325FD8A9